MLTSKDLGGSWFLDQLWKRIGVDKALMNIIEDRQFRTPVERTIFAMVANRALNPSSKLGLEHWVEHEAVIPQLDRMEAQHCYRAMDFLLESEETIQHEVFNAVADLFNLEVDLLFFDTTSTYFETEGLEDDDFRREGHSKDHRPDRPQVVIGLAVTREGIPIRCWVWQVTPMI
nr:IS1634 family transposase [Heliorestis acidaminivorans]